MSDAKITSLTANTTPALADVMVIVDDPAGTPVTQKITYGNVMKTTTRGDLIRGGVGGVPERVALGTTGTYLVSNGTDAVWAGHIYDYAEKTSNTSITATTEATANTVITGAAVTYDGSTAVEIQFYAPAIAPDSAAGRGIDIYLYDGSSSIGRGAFAVTQVGGTVLYGVSYFSRRITPSAAAHTYSIRASVTAGTGTVLAGAGGSGNLFPATLLIKRAA